MATNDEKRRDSERMGRGVHEGMDGGVSRNAHTSGERQGGTHDKGEGGYGDSSGFEGGGTEAPMETGSTPARTRPGDVGRQAESGMETRPSEGTTETPSPERQGDGAER